MYGFSSKYIKNKRKYTILIVDDIPENIELISTVLYIEGFEILFAESGQDALNQVEINEIDLILLDISMPEMDGYEVCRILKDNDSYKDIPIIFLTALNDAENIVKGFREGGQDYVTKPFNSDELLARIWTHIELKEKRTELEELAEILKKQKHTIERKNYDLTESIEYAHIIQTSLLPSLKKLDELLPNSFILYQPKDAVSGDFYYYEKIGEGKNEKIVIVAADCTGHGVPGAMLSVMGITMANQIIGQYEVDDPAAILKEMNSEFTSIFAGTGRKRATVDGIDAAICTYYPNENKIIYSGSKRPLYLLRNNEIIKYKAALYSIGGFFDESKKNFKNHEIKIEKGDVIYIFSDGYVDQFGGEANKKYGSSKFKKLLIEIGDKDVFEQKKLLKQELNNWQGDKEQIDDILIIGIKF